MSAAPLLAAVERLRASVDALPEHLREIPWRSFAEQVYVTVEGNDHVFAWASEPLRPHLDVAAEHIALTADPRKVRLLADLLAAIERADRKAGQRRPPEILSILDTALALASHLTEGSGNATT